MSGPTKEEVLRSLPSYPSLRSRPTPPAVRNFHRVCRCADERQISGGKLEREGVRAGRSPGGRGGEGCVSFADLHGVHVLKMGAVADKGSLTLAELLGRPIDSSAFPIAMGLQSIPCRRIYNNTYMDLDVTNVGTVHSVWCWASEGRILLLYMDVM